MAAVRVFVSYAHDSPGHHEAVRRLYELLRACGIDARWDLEAVADRQDWPVWMAGQVDAADFVVVVASPAYRRRADGGAEPDSQPGGGRGVQFEAALLRERLYADRAGWQRRILPVVLPGQSVDGIPTFLQPYSASRYEIREFTVDGAEELLRVLTDQPAHPPPALGEVPRLAPRGTTAGTGGTAAGISPAVRRLLLAQRDAAEALPDVATLGGHLPDASSVYVALRAGRVERPTTATPDGAPRGPVITDVGLADAVRAPGGAVLIGEPGAGKSTAMARVATAAADWWLADARGPSSTAPYGPVVPVVARAGRLGPSRLLPRALADALADTVEVPGGDLGLLFAAAPADGTRWLVVVDGLDEVLDAARRADLVRRVAGWMREPAAPYRLLVATRPLREGELAPLRAAGATEYRLHPFDEAGLEDFATKWFRAVDPDAAPDAVEGTVRRFLARVDTDSLRGLIRSPLLATIAAAVFHEASNEGDNEADPEADPEAGRAPLSSGRARLYDSFVRLLLRRRRSPREVAETAPDDVRARVSRSDPVAATLLWELFLHTRDLLGHLASRRLAGDPARPADLAAAWVTVPHEWSDAFDAAAGARARRLLENDPSWAHLVPALLAETGLLTHRGATLDFVHPSFAEYLAAGYRAAHPHRLGADEPPVTVESALAAIEDDATRSYGLFALAAGPSYGDAVGAAIEALMAGGYSDLVVLAAILADGVPMDPRRRRRAIDTLVDRCRYLGGVGSLHDEVVAAVVGYPHGIARLAAIAADAAEPAERRIGAAQLIASTGAAGPAGLAAIRPLLDDTEVDPHHRWRIALLLVRHGDATDRSDATGCLHRLLPERVRNWISTDDVLAFAEHGSAADRAVLARHADDPALPAGSRLSLAVALARFGDPVQRTAAVAVLRDLAPENSDAVGTLAEIEGTAGLRDLLVPGLPATVRVAAGTALVRGGPAEDRLAALEALAGVVASAEVGDWTRGEAAQILAAHGARDQVALVRRLSTDGSVAARARVGLAEALLHDGPVADREPARATLERLATDRSLAESDRIQAVLELTRNDEPAGLEVAVAIAADPAEPIDLRLRIARTTAIRSPRRYRAIVLGVLARFVTEPPAGPGYSEESAGQRAAAALAEYGGAAERSLLVRVCADGTIRPQVRRAAAAALFRCGTVADRVAARPILMTFAGDPEADLLDRRYASDALATHGGGDALEWLRELVVAGVADVRYGAAEALAEHGPPVARAQARQALLDLVADPTADGAARSMAATTVTTHGTQAELSTLVDLARAPTGDDETRLYAASGLTRARDADLSALAERVLTGLAADADVEPQVRYDALDQLAWHGRPSGMRLAATVASEPAEHPSMRLAAARLVITHEPSARARVGEGAELVAAALAAAADVLESADTDDDIDEDTAAEAAILLAASGKGEGVARALRVAAAPSATPRARTAAASAVCRHGAAADRAAVVEMLRADGVSGALRVAFAEPLLAAPEPAHSDAARDVLAAVAADAGVSAQVRRDALFELTYTVAASQPALLAIARAGSAPAPARCEAATALLETGSEVGGEHADEAEGILAGLAGDPATDWWTAVDAVIALTEHRPAALGRLVPALSDRRLDAMVRMALGTRLGTSEDEALSDTGVAAMRALAGDPDARMEARALAARWLSASGGPEQFAAFTDAPVLVRISAAAGLAEGPEDGEPARRTLTAIAEDRAQPVDFRAVAAVALVENGLVSASWIDELVSGAEHPYLRFAVVAAAVKSTVDGVDRSPLVTVASGGADAKRGDRMWMWAAVTLEQYGTSDEREVADATPVPLWADLDPLIRHIATTDWRRRRSEDRPRDALEGELMYLVDLPDGDRELRRTAAYELALHASGGWRVLARAVLADA